MEFRFRGETGCSRVHLGPGTGPQGAEQQEQKNTLAEKEAQRDAAQARITAEVDEEIEEISRREAWVPIRDELKAFLGAAADDGQQPALESLVLAAHVHLL